MATLRLDRPETLNALTFEVYRELTETFRALRERAATCARWCSPAPAAPSARAATCKEIIGDLLRPRRGRRCSSSRA